ncbi:MAG TPA: ketol-acid reductoisomerase [Gammaproteobacteria bacterium]|nr:ketol-acid reductoisomerase [Gammaproteobacteria bacterium]
MPLTVHSQNHIDPSILQGRRVAVLGYGAQGRAHALNLRDSGIDVVVGLRPGSKSRIRCERDAVAWQAIGAAVANASIVMLLVPDEAQPALYRDVLEAGMRRGAALAFAHGFNIHYGRIEPRPDLDVIMIAPLGIGDQVRRTYERGTGVPALVAVHADASGLALPVALAYAGANGHGRAAVFETSFQDETETDLFAEQAVLCGGVTHLVTAAFETLDEAGYPPELAYFCCLHELKLIIDLMYERGIAGMRRSISSTAEYGDYTRGPRVINEHTRKEMRALLAEIRSGSFAGELAAENSRGWPVLAEGRARAGDHAIERTGQRMRALMPWLARKDS